MIKRLLLRVADGPWTAAAVLTLGVVLAFAPDAFLIMLARAFLLQWTLFFGVLMALCVWRRAWWTATAAAMAGLLTLFPPLCHEQPLPAGGTGALRVAQMNVFQPNQEHEAVLRAALASDADLISFQEVDPDWAYALESGLAEVYPYHVVEPRTDCYGIAVFSRSPFTSVRVRMLEDTPAVEASVATPEGPMRVFAVHAGSPGNYGSFQRRNRQLAILTGWVAEEEGPTLVLGDLNTVSWDQALHNFCLRSGLREGQDGTTATWPSLLGLALIPLDHVLVSPGLGVSRSEVFRIPGSDHRGLAALITFR
ncbi:MAG: endonuclease/exonuclease/phosphatase family protein [Flavobacteriales bacterium]